MEWTTLKLGKGNYIRASEAEPTPYPQVTSVLPPEAVTNSLDFNGVNSFDFNLVRIVEEHGPKRLEQIDKEIKKHQDMIDRLAYEREKVQALVLALK